ncbi:MAG: hypothetical protein M3311_03275, partial [Thermoproteota archaeon]|nr:hypothetical protein [Thermoproteota archaeon]
MKPSLSNLTAKPHDDKRLQMWLKYSQDKYVISKCSCEVEKIACTIDNIRSIRKVIKLLSRFNA